MAAGLQDGQPGAPVFMRHIPRRTSAVPGGAGMHVRGRDVVPRTTP